MRSEPKENADAFNEALRPSLPWLGLSVALVVAGGLLTVSVLWMLVCFIGEPGVNTALWALALSGGTALCAALSSWLAHSGEMSFAARLREKVATHLMLLPPSAVSQYDGQKLRRLVADDIVALHHMIAHFPHEIATFLIVPLASICLLVAIGGWVSLAALIPGLVAALFILVAVPRLASREGKIQFDVMGDIALAVDDYARGIRVNRIFAAEAGAAARYEEATQRFSRGMVERVGRVATIMAMATALLQPVATFAIIYATGFDRPAQVLAASLFFSLAVVTPARQLGHGLDYISMGRAAAGRIRAFLAEASVVGGPVSDQPSERADLVVRNLSVMLADRPALAPVSHCFPAGTLTAITGTSGAGKTTLLRVLAGLEPPTTGTVLLADTPLAELAPANRTAWAALIAQGTDVLSAPIRDNLLLSAPDARDDVLQAALRAAQIEEGLDTDAERLSGGEKQRLNISRAYLSSAPLLLLDEPTSALDADTSRRVVDELRQLAKSTGKVIVMVTHDPAMAARADEILPLHPVDYDGARR
ncbi:ATP-binding cassette domain-containing protein [Altericroceibacterium indicum]